MQIHETSGLVPRLALFTLLLCTVLLCSGLGQASTAMLEHPRLDQHKLSQWNVEDGLNQNTVRAILQLPDNHLVVGTYEGLMRFDGLRFSAFPDDIPAQMQRNTTRMAMDHLGRIWVGGRDTGLLRLTARAPQSNVTGNQARYRWQPIDADGLLPSPHITALAADAETLWVGTPNGLLRLREEHWQAADHPELASASIQAIWSGQHHRLISTYTGEVWLGDDSGWQRLSLPGRNSTAPVRALEGFGPHLFIGTDEGVWQLDHQGRTLIRLGPQQGLSEPRVSALHADDDGLWIGSYGGGVYRWQHGQEMARLSSREGLSNDYIHSIFRDRENAIWIGSSGGLHRLRAGPFVTIGRPQGLSGDQVRSVIGDSDDNLWIGIDAGQGENGLYRLNADGGIRGYSTADGLPGNTVRSLTLAPNETGDTTLWVASYGDGVAYLDDDGRFHRPAWAADLPSARIRAMHFDNQGRFWLVSDDRGVFIRDADGQLNMLNRHRGLPSDRFNHIVEQANGEIWLASYGDGIVRQRIDGSIDHWRDHHSALPSDTLLTLHLDDEDILWAGFDKGLAFFRDEHWRLATPPEAPWSGAVLSLLDDEHGRLWLCLNQGIVTIDREALLQSPEALPDYRVFDHRDGLRSAQCNGGTQPAAWSGDGQHLWFATVEGLAGINAATSIDPPPLPVVLIHELKTSAGNALTSDEGPIRLGPETRRVELRFSAPTSVAPARVQFRYRLLDYDDDWIPAGDTRSAHYTRLPPGTLRFEVQARRPGQAWTEARSASLNFYRQARLHETWAFLIGMVALVALLLSGVYRFRTRQIHRHAQQLEQHVAERTRALQSTISQLQDTRSRLANAERLASMTRMLAGISHELNTPLGNGLVVSSRLQQIGQNLREQLSSSQPSRRQMESAVSDIDTGLSLIQTSLEKAAELLKRLRESSAAAREEEIVSFALADVLKELPKVAHERERSSHCQVIIDCPQSLRIRSNPRILRDVMLELIDNSAEHGFQGGVGQVRIRVSTCDDERIEIDYRDSGHGIDPQQREKIFEPMLSAFTSGDHSGLGMHRVFNQITVVLGGSIELLDDSTDGAHFRLLLPDQGPISGIAP